MAITVPHDTEPSFDTDTPT